MSVRIASSAWSREGRDNFTAVDRRHLRSDCRYNARAAKFPRFGGKPGRNAPLRTPDIPTRLGASAGWATFGPPDSKVESKACCQETLGGQDAKDLDAHCRAARIFRGRSECAEDRKDRIRFDVLGTDRRDRRRHAQVL